MTTIIRYVLLAPVVVAATLILLVVIGSWPFLFVYALVFDRMMAGPVLLMWAAAWGVTAATWHDATSDTQRHFG